MTPRVDFSNMTPVTTGLMHVDPPGFATVPVKPIFDTLPMGKFVPGVEKKGGVPENERAIVLLSP